MSATHSVCYTLCVVLSGPVQRLAVLLLRERTRPSLRFTIIRNVYMFRISKLQADIRPLICVFQVSRPYLGFCSDPKYFIVNCEQNVVKFVGKCIEKCNFYVKYFDKIKCYADRPYLVFSELKPETHIYCFCLTKHTCTHTHTHTHTHLIL